MHEQLLTILVIIVALGIVAQWLAWWLKLPSILFLLIFGVTAGPVLHLLNPDELLGELLFPVASLGVAVVLFEGALTLKFREISGHGKVVFNLVTWGATAGWILMASGIWLFTDFDWPVALLFAALVVVTGPTVIIPLLRNVRPNASISQILRWEGILIDPIGAIFAVLVFELIVSEFRGASYMVLLLEIGTGVATGIAGGAVLAFLLRRHLVPEYLHNVFTLCLVLSTFALSNHFAQESGLLAVTVMGVWLANAKALDISDILQFKESLSVLIVSILFILLAARIDPGVLIANGWESAIVLLVVLLVRPLIVMLATLKTKLQWQEKLLIGWIGPRGIVAAAVASVFALKLSELGLAGGERIAGMTFLVIVVTVLLSSITARPLARLLGVAEEDPRGVLIVGANNVALAVGKALKELGFQVRLASNSWPEIQSARMAGLDTYYGNPISAHADQHLDLVGIGRLFAMSLRPALNSLACLKFRNEFGLKRVFSLRNAEEKKAESKSELTQSFKAPRLFGKDITLQKLASLIGQGAEIKSTRISEEFSADKYWQTYGKSAIPLFYLDQKQRLRAYTDEHNPELRTGHTIVSLVSKTREKADAAKEINKQE